MDNPEALTFTLAYLSAVIMGLFYVIPMIIKSVLEAKYRPLRVGETITPGIDQYMQWGTSTWKPITTSQIETYGHIMKEDFVAIRRKTTWKQHYGLVSLYCG